MIKIHCDLCENEIENTSEFFAVQIQKVENHNGHMHPAGYAAMVKAPHSGVRQIHGPPAPYVEGFMRQQNHSCTLAMCKECADKRISIAAMTQEAEPGT